MSIWISLEAVGQIATAIGVVVAAYALWQSKKAEQRQYNMQAFLEYTARFERVMESFPEDAFRARYNLSGALPPPSKELTSAVLRYLNITSEEYYLWQKRYLDEAVWSIWQDEIIRTLRSPLFQREWPRLKHELETFKDFVIFVDREQHNAPMPQPRNEDMFLESLLTADKH